MPKSIPRKNSTDIPLAELLAIAMRYARERDGYDIVGIDRAVAQALLVESMQRVAMLDDTPPGETPDRSATLEIFNVVLDDVRVEALHLMRRELH